MGDYTFFNSERRQYDLGECRDKLALVERRNWGIELSRMLGNPYDHKIDEAIAFGCADTQEGLNFEQFSPDQERNGWEIFAHMYLVTELPYEQDGRLKVAKDLVALASFEIRENRLLFNIDAHGQLGVNPEVLYKFAEEHGRRIEH